MPVIHSLSTAFPQLLGKSRPLPPGSPADSSIPFLSAIAPLNAPQFQFRLDLPLLDIIPIADVDPNRVEALLDAAFGTDRHGRTAYRLRAGTSAIPELSLAALEDGHLVGTLQSWPVRLTRTDGADQPMVMVGPVAVTPERQRAGIGLALMNRMIAIADANGADAMVMIGDPEYYDRLFGFNAAQTGAWEVPGPVERHRLLARLKSDRLNGLAGMLAPDPARSAVLR
mgnify:FL=1